ncbi:MAG: CopG family transcriptional regulator, partial [Methanosarcinales archaeon]|nr:CopG family transcriptional regulator [Methanosarcinales archaeon]
MKAPKRITIALDDETSDLLENMKKSGMNQSNII